MSLETLLRIVGDVKDDEKIQTDDYIEAYKLMFAALSKLKDSDQVTVISLLLCDRVVTGKFNRFRGTEQAAHATGCAACIASVMIDYMEEVLIPTAREYAREVVDKGYSKEFVEQPLTPREAMH